MILSVGDIFPAFEIDVCNASNELTTETIEADGTWKVVYFYPKDFTFICPTEIADMDKLTEGFDVKVIGISGDNEFCKLQWKQSNELIGNIRHSLGADTGLNLSKQVGAVDSSGSVCIRATFILDGDNVVKHVSANELDTGRNGAEVLRTLQALQAGGLTGCSWTPGEDFVG